MDNLKIYQICYDLIDYFPTLTSPKKSYLGPIFRTRGYFLINPLDSLRSSQNLISSLLLYASTCACLLFLFA